jgi:hypothetical protein
VSRRVIGRVAFAAAALFCITPYASPGIALAAGLVLALTLGNPLPASMRAVSDPRFRHLVGDR